MLHGKDIIRIYRLAEEVDSVQGELSIFPTVITSQVFYLSSYPLTLRTHSFRMIFVEPSQIPMGYIRPWMCIKKDYCVLRSFRVPL